MIVREVRGQDLREVIELLQDVSGFRPDESSYETIWAGYRSQGACFSVVAEDDGIIIGFGSVSIETKIRGGRMGHIEDIVSHRDHRNVGVGNRILEELSNIARSHGCYKISLQCNENNVEFYQRCGFGVGGVAMQKFL